MDLEGDKNGDQQVMYFLNFATVQRIDVFK